MNVRIPFKITCSPIRQLALINFEKKPDEIYHGLELQYIEGQPYGEGYRVLAYRNDEYVDVYDDENLYFLEDETFNVAGNGLHRHVQTVISGVEFSCCGGQLLLAFSFTDIEGRTVEVSIRENTGKESTPMNLLAPIGVGSANPNFLPVFFMYDFQFVRRAKTEVVLKIGGKDIPLDKFPMPMDGQLRYYTRYSLDCQIIEFIDTGYDQMFEVETDENLCYEAGAATYRFNAEGGLEEILLKTGGEDVRIDFTPGFALREGSGTFGIYPGERMGEIAGIYELQSGESEGSLQLFLTPSDGWKSVPTSTLSQMIMGPKSQFCCWSKRYDLRAEILPDTGAIRGIWTNNNHGE